LNTHKEQHFDNDYPYNYRHNSHKCLSIPEELNDWAIIYENTMGLRNKINEMVDKMSNTLSEL
jgi:hypothetical protein